MRSRLISLPTAIGTYIISFLILGSALSSYAQKSQGEALKEALELREQKLQEYERRLREYEKKKGQEKEQFYAALLDDLLKAEAFEKAEELIRSRLAQSPDNYQYQLDLADLYQKAGDQKAAQKQYLALLKDLPDQPDDITRLAYRLFSSGQGELAVEALKKGRKNLKDEGLFGLEIARLYYLQRQPSMVIQELLALLDHKPGYMPAIKGQLQYYLREEADYSLLENELEKRVRKSRQDSPYTDLLIWSFLQKQQFEEALATAEEYPQNDPGKQTKQLIHIAQISTTNKAYSTAVKAYDLVEGQRDLPEEVQKEVIIGRLDARYQEVTGKQQVAEKEILELEKAYRNALEEFGESRETVFLMKRLAEINVSYLNRLDEGIRWMQSVVDTKGLPAISRGEAKLRLGDYYTLKDDVWEATLLYGQVEKAFKDNPLGQEARFRSARLSYYMGEFEWAKGQLDVLKAATSQFIANDALNMSLLISENPGPDSTYGALKQYARAELYTFRNQTDKALDILDSITVRFPGHDLSDDILMAKANIYLKKRQYDQAIPFLEKVATDHAHDIWGDDALFRLAEIYEKRPDGKSKAQEYYEKILLEHPGSLFVVEARKRFRILRGDIPPREEKQELITEPHL